MQELWFRNAKRIEKKEHKKKKKEETPNQWVKILSHEGFKFLSFLVLQRRNAKGREHWENTERNGRLCCRFVFSQLPPNMTKKASPHVKKFFSSSHFCQKLPLGPTLKSLLPGEFCPPRESLSSLLAHDQAKLSLSSLLAPSLVHFSFVSRSLICSSQTITN